jgi:hypothetical protein
MHTGQKGLENFSRHSPFKDVINPNYALANHLRFLKCSYCLKLQGSLLAHERRLAGLAALRSGGHGDSRTRGGIYTARWFQGPEGISSTLPSDSRTRDGISTAGWFQSPWWHLLYTARWFQVLWRWYLHNQVIPGPKVISTQPGDSKARSGVIYRARWFQDLWCHLQYTAKWFQDPLWYLHNQVIPGPVVISTQPGDSRPQGDIYTTRWFQAPRWYLHNQVIPGPKVISTQPGDSRSRGDIYTTRW